MAAATKLFGIQELAEMMFLQFPMRDILVIQRVGKDWQKAVVNSKQLQRKTFLLSCPGAPLELSENVRGHPLSCSNTPDDLIEYKQDVYILPATAEEAAGWKYMWLDPKATTREPKAVYENPVLYELEERVDAAFRAGSFKQTSLPAAWARPEASWRRMVITQPSIRTTISLELDQKEYGEHALATHRVQDSKNMVLGQMINAIYSDSQISKIAKKVKDVSRRKHYRVLIFDIPFSLLWEETEWDWPGEEGGDDSGSEDSMVYEESENESESEGEGDWC